MTAFVPRTSAQHLEELIAGVVTRSDLTNIRPSSALLKMLQIAAEKFEAADVAIYGLRALADLDRTAGPDLRNVADKVLPDGLPPAAATYAAGPVVFVRPTSSGVVPIPKGTVVSQTKDGTVYYYETTAAGQWLDGATTSAPINVRAQIAGAGPSAAIGAVDTIVSNITAVSVSNTEKLTGQDEETDAQIRQKIRAHIRSLSRATRPAIVAAVRTAALDDGTSVQFAVPAEHDLGPPRGVVYVDDGRGTAGPVETVAGETLVSSAYGGERLLYTSRAPWRSAPVVRRNGTVLVLGTDYTVVEPWGQIRLTTALTAGQSLTVDAYDVYGGLVAAAQTIVNGSASDTATYPGYRADGTVIYVLPAVVVTSSVSGALVVATGYPNARTDARTAILEYINGLDIGAPRFASRIIERAMSVAGAIRFTMSSMADIYVQPNQVHRASQSDVVIT